jgi:hypothetical protein
MSVALGIIAHENIPGDPTGPYLTLTAYARLGGNVPRRPVNSIGWPSLVEPSVAMDAINGETDKTTGARYALDRVTSVLKGRPSPNTVQTAPPPTPAAVVQTRVADEFTRQPVAVKI